MDEPNPYQSPQAQQPDEADDWIPDFLIDVIVALLCFLALAIPGILIAWMMGATN